MKKGKQREIPRAKKPTSLKKVSDAAFAPGPRAAVSSQWPERSERLATAALESSEASGLRVEVKVASWGTPGGCWFCVCLCLILTEDMPGEEGGGTERSV